MANSPEDIENYRKAGKIAAEALNYGVSLIKPGVSVVEVCKKVDQKILDLGGSIAFPTQINLDDVAAHFCPLDDSLKFKEQVCCIDVGAHVNGCIGDNAASVDLSGKNENLIKASREALDNAVKIIKPGVKLGEIGKVIHQAITNYGFSPVKNLSGHGLGKYMIHTKPNIPNYDNNDPSWLEEGDIVAIEPFASSGAGIIYESSNPTVFSLVGKKPARGMITREVLKEIASYEGMPFCTRWLIEKFGEAKTNFAIREIANLGILAEHPPLIDQKHGLVSQAEHTILVTKTGCEILTKC